MTELNQKISAIGVVPVIKLNHPERDAAGLAKALCAGGVPVAEVTFRAEGADKAIRIIKETCPEMLAGAGTVTTTEQIDKVLAVGGDFVVSPGFDPELVEYAQKKGIPVYPGCTTTWTPLVYRTTPTACPPSRTVGRRGAAWTVLRGTRPRRA